MPSGGIREVFSQIEMDLKGQIIPDVLLRAAKGSADRLQNVGAKYFVRAANEPYFSGAYSEGSGTADDIDAVDASYQNLYTWLGIKVNFIELIEDANV